MRLKSNKSFSLLEVVITVAILTSAITVVLRAFTTIISGVNLSQNITMACLLAEDKLWRLENGFALEESAEEKPEFSYTQETLDTGIPGLDKLKLGVSWEEKRANPYSLEFYVYNITTNPAP